MRVNFVDDNTVTPFLAKTMYRIATVIVDVSDEILKSTASDFTDEEADMNVYFTPYAFDEDTSTEVAVIVTREYPMDATGEALLERADRIAVTTQAFQEEIYNLTGVLSPIVNLGDYEAINDFLTGAPNGA